MYCTYFRVPIDKAINRSDTPLTKIELAPKITETITSPNTSINSPLSSRLENERSTKTASKDIEKTDFKKNSIDLFGKAHLKNAEGNKSLELDLNKFSENKSAPDINKIKPYERER